MDFILNLTLTAIGQVALTLVHNWPYLLVGILIAALLKRYINADKLSSVLLRYQRVGVLASTVAAVVTPLCSCGTTAVILGMIASTIPWAPIVAFMVASPLTSPEELFYSAGLFGWPFAVAFFLTSIFLGLAGGGIAAWFENMGWLKNQVRFIDTDAGHHENRSGVWLEPPAAIQPPAVLKPPATNQPLAVQQVSSCECSQPATAQAPVIAQPVAFVLPDPGSQMAVPTLACACSQAQPVSAIPADLACCDGSQLAGRNTPIFYQSAVGAHYQKLVSAMKGSEIVPLLKEIFNSARQLLPIFLGFAFIGYFLNGLIPASWVASLFGAGSIYSVPLAATLGLPLYFNTEGSLPLVRALLDNGMSQGAALAFMISGAGTSFGAIAGALTIARWRVVALVVGILWMGAIFSGYIFNLLLALNVF